MNLKHLLTLTLFLPSLLMAQSKVQSPDGNLSVEITADGGQPAYQVAYKGKTILEKSPLGLVTNLSDLSQGLTLKGGETRSLDEHYTPTPCWGAFVRAALRGVPFTSNRMW